MRERIGISLGHGEAVTPAAGDFSLFFELLRGEGRALEPIEGPLTAAALRDCTALLVGAPAAPIEDAEVAAALEWVRAGGRLLSLLGDSSPGGVEALAGARAFAAAGGRARGVKAQPIDLDAAPLVRRRVTLSYLGGALTPGSDAAPDLALPLPGAPGGYALLGWREGEGERLVFGGAYPLRDEALSFSENLAFLSWLSLRWLPRLCAEELRLRKRKPQRHRLLHGYPMAPLMRRYRDVDWDRFDPLESALTPDPGRPALLGILPHPFCNPAVRGCGFCTFPQEAYSSPAAAECARLVAGEIAARAGELAGRRVAGVYFGGGTANLTPPAELAGLCRALRGAADTSGAEVTLEGVPIYFVAKRPSLLAVLAGELPARHRRISMGLQTFDPAQLARMGRAAYGGAAEFAAAVRAAHDAGFTASGDLLFNLPGQDLPRMLDDVERAIEIGLDQIGLYHLVLFDGLGTEWSRDRALLQQLPQNPRGCAAWQALRERLLARGFVQTTLTNFERAGLAARGEGFLYEAAAFTPEGYDILGFGPSGLSFVFDRGMTRALKRMNPAGAADYAAMRRAGEPCERFFLYGAHDAKLLYLTRKIARLAIPRGGYRALFGRDVLDDFPAELAALAADGLVELREEAVALTPAGMFYGDTVAGLLAWRRVQELRVMERALARDRHDLGWLSPDRDINESMWNPMG